MKNELSITYDNDNNLVFVQITGTDSYEVSLDMFKKVVEVCKQHNCFNILGVQDMTPLNTIDAYDHTKIFKEVGITTNYRIAWVEKNPETLKMLKFVENVLVNRSMVYGKVFSDISEARSWLMKNRKA